MYFDDASEQLAKSGDKGLGFIGGVLALAVSPLGYLAIPFLSAVTLQAARSLF
jgi:NADH-quinone oxidoreductase subunit N